MHSFSPSSSSSSSSPYMASLLLLLFITSFSFAQSSYAPSPDVPPFLYALQSQCSVDVSPTPPRQADGDFIDAILSGRKSVGQISILFYASWCPFSQRLLPDYEVLSSMFPHVEYLALEQSSALPSLYSKYGIHSLPAILLVNQSCRVRYRGPRNLKTLVEFYERNTGFEANLNIVVHKLSSLMRDEHSTMKSLVGVSLKEILRREPYLVFSVLFLCLRMLLFVFPKIMSRLRAFWNSYAPHLNLQIFSETSQVMMGRVRNAVDVRRIWNKLRLCKTRNFHERARSAKAWASSLASVSLGESASSTRCRT
ncbi:5'-adenylylsulfate reductase-like 5 [Arachis stenosperma]|uniref:5'-adenylylsulfate reductase-like 5 n=1 Tax=Arachis stenosperma TaxID=217475 RepID=UPI0025AB903B|nr:5'-adenylylsulfate reductase-like 5 [Arachis stenosperma]